MRAEQLGQLGAELLEVVQQVLRGRGVLLLVPRGERERLGPTQAMALSVPQYSAPMSALPAELDGI